MAFATFDVVETTPRAKKELEVDLKEFDLTLVDFGFGNNGQEVKISGIDNDIELFLRDQGYNDGEYVVE